MELPAGTTLFSEKLLGCIFQGLLLLLLFALSSIISAVAVGVVAAAETIFWKKASKVGLVALSLESIPMRMKIEGATLMNVLREIQDLKMMAS